MRRKEFLSVDQYEFEQISNESKIGYLSMVNSDGFPTITPLNFVLMDQYIYFHGANEGEKFDLFQTNPKITFNMVIPYSSIPSYWISKDYACHASTFFKSAIVRGFGTIVRDIKEKAEVLNLLMKKYQPEGNFIPIKADEPLYYKSLASVALFKINPTEISVKVKFGQNLSESKRQKLVKYLEERNDELDKITASEIKKTLST